MNQAADFESYKRFLAYQIQMLTAAFNSVVEIEESQNRLVEENNELRDQIEHYRKREAMRLAADNRELTELPGVKIEIPPPPSNIHLAYGAEYQGKFFDFKNDRWTNSRPPDQNQ